MRLAKDFSNINDFAYFVGGTIVPAGGRDDAPAIHMPDNWTWLHGGYYVTMKGTEPVKWYPKDFEEMFEAKGDLEILPEGWEAYPPDFDFSVFGEVVHEFTEEEQSETYSLAIQAHFATFLTRKSKIAKLKANPGYAKISFALHGDPEGEASSFEAVAMMERSSMKSALGGKTRLFHYGPDRYVLVRGYTASKIATQQYLNRSLLTKP